jgi:hypothetical protein
VNAVFRKISFITVIYANGVVRTTSGHESVDDPAPY